MGKDSNAAGQDGILLPGAPGQAGIGHVLPGQGNRLSWGGQPDPVTEGQGGIPNGPENTASNIILTSSPNGGGLPATWFNGCNESVRLLCGGQDDSATIPRGPGAWSWVENTQCYFGVYRPRGVSVNASTCIQLGHQMVTKISGGNQPEIQQGRASININTGLPNDQGFPQNTSYTGISLAANSSSWIMQAGSPYAGADPADTNSQDMGSSSQQGAAGTDSTGSGLDTGSGSGSGSDSGAGTATAVVPEPTTPPTQPVTNRAGWDMGSESGPGSNPKERRDSPDSAPVPNPDPTRKQKKTRGSPVQPGNIFDEDPTPAVGDGSGEAPAESPDGASAAGIVPVLPQGVPKRH